MIFGNLRLLVLHEAKDQFIFSKLKMLSKNIKVSIQQFKIFLTKKYVQYTVDSKQMFNK